MYNFENCVLHIYNLWARIRVISRVEMKKYKASKLFENLSTEKAKSV